MLDDKQIWYLYTYASGMAKRIFLRWRAHHDQDSVHDAATFGLVKALRDWDKERGPIQPLLYYRVLDECRQWVRENIRTKKQAEAAAVPTEPVTYNEERRDVRDRVARLPALEKLVAGRLFEGYQQREIWRELGLDHRKWKRLKKSLQMKMAA